MILTLELKFLIQVGMLLQKVFVYTFIQMKMVI